MVRHDGNVRAHRERRENIARPRLDGLAADGIRIVARPRLRHVVKHRGVETPAASGAALEKNVGKRLCDALEHRVKAEHIAMLRLPLAFRRASGGKGLGEMSVEVPFHIVDDARLENL